MAAIFVIGCSRPETWEINQWYTQLSRYKDREIRAFSIHVKVMEDEKIQKICDLYFEKYAEPDRYLRLDFFDDRSFTPDFSDGIEINQYQNQHRIAQFFYDPFRDQKRLEFY